MSALTREGFTTVRVVGPMLPPDLLGRVVAGDKDLAGLRPADYHLAAGETPREAANRAWAYLRGVWSAFRAAVDQLPADDPAVGLTREKWLLVLFRELGYGRVPATPTGGLVVDDRAFGVSHLWGRAPIHLLGWNVPLDKRTKGVPGAAERAPHPMLQECLNRTDDYLWALLSNGRVLRILRDSTSLAGASYVEFDLEAMFDGEVFSDFALLYLTAHQSRVEVLTPDGPASDCWLERWRTASIESGTRARELLRDGVKEAIEALGCGFLAHPANTELRERLDAPRSDERHLDLADYHRSLLRLVYRLLFLFVAEDRGALLVGPGKDATPEQRHANALAHERYTTYFSTARLRRLALRRRGTRHGDLWAGLSLVIDALGRDGSDAPDGRGPGGRPELGLPGLGGLFDHGPADVVTGHALPNDALLTAIRHLSVVQPKGQAKRTVDYRNLGAEELGSIYESLLELVPRRGTPERPFLLENLAGNDRKTSGSYYTPSSLIDLLLDEALDPLLDEAEKAPDPESALLGLTVCDPACGSGHFLVAAARRIAARLARVRTEELDPSPTDLQIAMHDVVSACIYGVDLNPMAAELARVSLWLEALEPGRPLSFLDAHIKVGNALLGTTPALLAAGIPDAAYKPIEGDDKKWAAALRKRNRAEIDERLSRQGDLFADAGLDVSNAALRRDLARIETAPVRSLADQHIARARYTEYENSPERRRALRLADTWCAAFVQLKTEDGPSITDKVLTAVAEDREPVEARDAVADLTARYRFFHWHLEFPGIFDSTGNDAANPRNSAGWSAGFSAMIGNPPWETVQMSEKEFFAARNAHVAEAPNAAARKKRISALQVTDPGLYADFIAESRRGEAENALVRDSGRYPLCARGKINTYSIFAEHMRTCIALAGRMGIITPTGLATDATTAAFFADTLRAERLAAFYDFDNEAKIFANVHHAFRFAVSCMTGGEPVDEARLAFVTRHVADIPTRRFALSANEILLLNPNTGTLPLFRARIDAEITAGIYRRHPVLIREGDRAENPWGLTFKQGLFNMASDSGLFRTDDDLTAAGAQFDGWAWVKGPDRWLPLYEAKLLSHWDHRYSTYADATQAQLNMQTLPRVTDEQHDVSGLEALTRYWVAEPEIEAALGDRWDRNWVLGWRDITGQEKWRTFVPSVLPRAAVGHVFPLAFPADPTHAPLLQAIWSSLPFDYVSRQKLSGTHMTYGIVNQLACPAPATFALPAPWSPSATLDAWIRPRVLELTYTSWRIAPYANDVLQIPVDADPGPPFRWIPERRELLRAELDAAMFHVYGLDRAETEHVLDSFPVVRKYEERDHGEFRTKRLVLDRYDAMAQCVAAGTPYASPLDPKPGSGPRHPAQ